MATYSVPEAAKKLGLGVQSVYRYCQKGRLGRKVNGRYRITGADLRQFAGKSRKPGWPAGKSRKS